MSACMNLGFELPRIDLEAARGDCGVREGGGAASGIRWVLRWVKCFAVSLLVVGSVQAGELPEFKAQTVTSSIKFGYQLVAADLTGDGKKDLIAIDERATELAWFENPTWERHVLATDVPRPLNAACHDIDGDGVPEVVLAYRFECRPEDSVGNVVLLKEDGGRAPALECSGNRSGSDGAPGPLDRSGRDGTEGSASGPDGRSAFSAGGR